MGRKRGCGGVTLVQAENKLGTFYHIQGGAVERVCSMCVGVYNNICMKSRCVRHSIQQYTILVFWCESQQSLWFESRVPGLVLYHCIIEVQQMDNHKTSQSSNCFVTFSVQAKISKQYCIAGFFCRTQILHFASKLNYHEPLTHSHDFFSASHAVLCFLQKADLCYYS